MVITTLMASFQLMANITMIVPINSMDWEIISKKALFKALKMLSRSLLNKERICPSWWVSK